ncbi:DUF4159 domain-containing protein [Robiginitomaculum antarcticum]|uniref:DUF4159 domain-containing protein n=1 Tax=Robiginitomaculum antarcticum TaxID=437507 RepID=UPI00036F0968|nr:DUF4159 domain-containing protein [Robiginitomaculum antarcticum]
MSWGAITFLAPLGLLGLIVLPLIWWLLRATPPRPKDQIFPPLRIFSQIRRDEEMPDRTPWWLLVFRMAMIAILAVALARPFLSERDTQAARDIVMVIDDGFGAAANWSRISNEAEVRLIEARRQNLNVMLIYGQRGGESAPVFAPATAALETVRILRPTPRPVDHIAMTAMIGSRDLGGADAVWFSGGTNFGDAQTLDKTLSGAASKTVLIPDSERMPIFAEATQETAQGFEIIYRRADTASARTQNIIAYGSDGRVIARAPAAFGLGERTAAAEFELPSDLRNQVSRIRPEGQSSAAGVKLLDDSWGRPVVGLVSVSDDTVQPLLSETFYLEKALGPSAEIYKAPLSELLDLAPTILVMPDDSRVQSEGLVEFVENGGLLIRFAGPKLAARSDDLLPVELRFGDRALGGALTWEEPQTLAPFEPDSPFFGLSIPSDVQVTQQVMAQPSTELDSKTWARLSDGSPVVTSAPRGQGRIVLFHVTSDPEWSNLAVSGLYVGMLKRILPLARRRSVAPDATGGAWAADRILDGMGRLVAPPASAVAIDDAVFDATVPSARHPAGLYQQGERRRALNAVPQGLQISAISDVTGAGQPYGKTRTRTLEGILLAIGLTMLAFDALLALFVTGRFARLMPRRRAAALTSLILAAVILTPQLTEAQSQDRPPASQDFNQDALALHFAYVITGNSVIDRNSEAGLRGVTKALFDRTTVEPQAPRGLNIETDNLLFYPFIYWPVTRDAAELSEAAAKNVNGYLAAGGTIIFDTQDQGDRAVFGGGAHPGLARISKPLDIPELQPIPKDHVLTKTFFLLENFPGRYSDGQVWVDAKSISARDGVASVIVGSNDWATGWAVSAQGEYIGAVDDTMPRQIEFARRFGVNLGMYVLSGNYKADQVHAQAILDRLRPESEREQRQPQQLQTEPQ